LCQHNLNYWEFGDYIGLGAGAHGKITVPPEGKVWRTQMPASPGGYVAEMTRPNPGRTTLVTDQDAVFEFMLNTLRLQKGFDLSLFELRTGLPISKIDVQLTEMQQNAWAVIDQNRLQLTPKGQQYLNDVVGLFL
jgi:oxygen-independent coproporphyrinogen-3 oxidase